MTRYVSLAEYLWLGEQVTGIDANSLAKISRIELVGRLAETADQARRQLITRKSSRTLSR